MKELEVFKTSVSFMLFTSFHFFMSRSAKEVVSVY